MRQTEIRLISDVFGADKLVDETFLQTCAQYQLMQWPRSKEAQIKPETWRLCLEHSPDLRKRLVLTDENEMRRMFGIGASVQSDKPLSAEQVSECIVYRQKQLVSFINSCIV